MGRVLVVERDVDVSSCFSSLLDVPGLVVESARTEMEAYRRLSQLPTIRLVLIQAGFGGGQTVDAIGRFARQVSPSVVLVTVDLPPGRRLTTRVNPNAQ